MGRQMNVFPWSRYGFRMLNSFTLIDICKALEKLTSVLVNENILKVHFVLDHERKEGIAFRWMNNVSMIINYNATSNITNTWSILNDN